MSALSSAVPSWGLQVHLGCVRLSPACPCRCLHTCHLRPARHYPRLGIRPPSSGDRRDLNPPDHCAAWRTLRIFLVSLAFAAQRRPGRSPRRHVPACPGHQVRVVRSTKAGAFTPATRAVGDDQLGPQGRSTKAGAFTPATPADAAGDAQGAAGAQRRPGRSPRRHEGDDDGPTDSQCAQRRPGRSPQRHPAGAVDRRLADVRSTKAGAFTPATPASRGGVRAGQVLRSTKAGAFTPATRRRPPGGGLRCGSLNEGRGVHPGDTHAVATVCHSWSRRSTKAGAFTPATPAGHSGDALNEGRGVHPGDTRLLDDPPLVAERSTRRTPTVCDFACRDLRTLNEGRGVHPGDTRMLWTRAHDA